MLYLSTSIIYKSNIKKIVYQKLASSIKDNEHKIQTF